jgi:CheY-like chemotaxis protein
LAAISHELRTPLQAIIAFSQLAQMDWPSGVDRRYLSRIDQASRLMLRVVNDLLDLSHLERGTLEVLPDQPLDLSNLLAQVLATADGLRQGRPIALYLQADDLSGLALRGDGKRIEQVLLNLLANALRFTDSGAVTLGARVLARDAHVLSVRLSVGDSGVGMSEDTLDRVLDPDRVAVGGGTAARGGSGFGLRIVHRLLQRMGSQLLGVSVQGGGSLMWFDLQLQASASERLTFTLDTHDAVFSANPYFVRTVQALWSGRQRPLLVLQDPEHQASHATGHWVIDQAHPQASRWLRHARLMGRTVWSVNALPAEGQGHTLALLADTVLGSPQAVCLQVDPALRGLHVLVVEDNLLNQEVVRDQLRRMGAEASTAASCGEARAMLVHGPFDVVLADMQLPDDTGLGLGRWLREHSRLAAQPFILLSAHLSADDRQAAQALGALGCLLKPHDPQELQALLRQLPSRRAPLAGSTAPAGTGIERAQAGLRALSGLDLKVLFRSEWPALRLALQRAQGALEQRKAVHAIRGSLAVLGHSPELLAARALEEQLLAGQVLQAAQLQSFLNRIEVMLGLWPPHPG